MSGATTEGRRSRAAEFIRGLLAKPGPRTRRSMWIDAGVLAGLLLLTLLVMLINARRRFEFFDMSAFLDAGYRVAIGQRPYVDFYYIAGPVHLYMHALSFKLFGFNQVAVLAHLCSVALAVTAILYVMARFFFNAPLSALVAVIGIFSFYGPICHPWYDQNAAFFVALALLLGHVGAHCWKESTLPGVGFVCGMLLGVSFLTKANVALAGAVAVFLLFLSGPNRIRATVFYVLGGFLCLALFAFFMTEPWLFIDQAFLSYAPGKRLGDWTRLGRTLGRTLNVYVLAAAAVMALSGGWSYTRKNLHTIGMMAGVTFTAVFSTWTGSMFIPANTLWLGFQVLYLLMLAQALPLETPGEGHTSGGGMRRLGCWAAGLFVISLSLYTLYDSVRKTEDLLAWTWNPHILVSDYVLKTPEFQGWGCNRLLGEPLDHAVQFVKENVPPNESLFVFPDCTMIYGLTGRDSYRKMPFIFHAEVMVHGAQKTELRNHFLAHPPQWVVFHDQWWHFNPDMTARANMRWLKLEEFMNPNYQIVWRSGDIMILKLAMQPHPQVTPGAGVETPAAPAPRTP